MVNTGRRLNLDEVLDELFLEQKEPTLQQLIKACETYPRFRQDIMEFAALWSIYDAAPEIDENNSESMVREENVSRLQSVVLNRMYELDNLDNDVEEQSDSISNVQAILSSLKGGAALRRASNASGLGEQTLLLQKILSRAVDVPAQVLAPLAAYLKVSVRVMEQALQSTETVSRSYSSKQKPIKPIKETWGGAVRSLSISDEEKSRLLALQDEGE